MKTNISSIWNQWAAGGENKEAGAESKEAKTKINNEANNKKEKKHV
jgi:hypothetical protein